MNYQPLDRQGFSTKLILRFTAGFLLSASLHGAILSDQAGLKLELEDNGVFAGVDLAGGKLPKGTAGGFYLREPNSDKKVFMTGKAVSKDGKLQLLLNSPLQANVTAVVTEGDGFIDLSAVLLGKTLENVRDHTVQHGVAGTMALRKGNWKYLPATAKDAGGGMGTGANASDERFAAAFIPEPMLFDLATDPGEKMNVIAKHPEKAKELAAELASIVANDLTSKTQTPKQ
jgi:hypothetical protein